MFDLGAIIAHVTADISGFKKGMDEAKTEANGFGSTLKTIGSGIKDFANQAAVFTAVAATGAVAFGKSALDAYNEAEAASAQLVHAVKDVTKATNEELAATFKLSQELEKKGVLDADNINIGLAQLSTFGLSNKAVRGLGKSLADLAVNQFGVNATGEQLSQTANTMAKALNGQFGVLEKSGIRFTEAQKHIIQYGTEMEKVKAINEGFAQNLKYTNEVALTTMEGKLAAVNVKFGNFKESIGGVLSALAEVALTGDRSGIASDPISALFPDEKTAQMITDVINKIIGALFALSDWVQNNQQLVITFLQGLAIAIGALLTIGTITILLTALLNPLVLASLAVAALYTAWQTNFMGIQTTTMAVVAVITDLFNNYLQPMFLAFTAWLNDYFYPAFNMVFNGLIVPMFNAFVGWFKDRWDYITLIVKGTWEMIANTIKFWWDLASGIVTAGLQLLTGNWKGAWETIKSTAGRAWEDLKGIFGGAIDFVRGWGGTLVHELVKPFEDAWNKAKEWADKIKGLMDPNQRHSPSLVDRVQKGVRDLNSAWDGLNMGTQGISAQMAPTSGIGLAPAAAVGGGATMITIDMSGAYIGSEQIAQEMGETIGDSIIRKLQVNLRI